MKRFRAWLGWQIAEVAKQLVRLGVWVSGSSVELPTDETYDAYRLFLDAKSRRRAYPPARNDE